MEGEESGMPPGEPELMLRRCLDARTRRWAAAEFFYSAVDRPWFMQNELKVCVRSESTALWPDYVPDVSFSLRPEAGCIFFRLYVRYGMSR